MSQQPFDAARHLKKVSGKDYLEVKWRLVWLRTEHPYAQIHTELVEHKPREYAVMKATIKIYDQDPEGIRMGEASGYGSETIGDFNDYLEKAETKAIGRALAALGYGTQFTPELEEGERIVDAPVERQRPPAPVPAQPTGVTQQARQRPQPTPVQPQPQAPRPQQQGTQSLGKPASDKQWKMIRDLADNKGIAVDDGELLLWAQETVRDYGRQDGSRSSITVPGDYNQWNTQHASGVIDYLKSWTDSDFDAWRQPVAENVMFLGGADDVDYSDVDTGAPPDDDEVPF